MHVVKLDRAEIVGGRLASLQGAAAVRIGAWWDRRRCEEAAEAVLAARSRWVRDFDGEQFCLGRAWYTHLETDRAAEYFEAAPLADLTVEEVLPGLQASMREALGGFVGGPVVQRRGWCGAGVHVFPAGDLCARRGGDLHFDHEGLTRAQLRARSPALSLVLMLQAPDEGGALRLWDARYGGSERPTPDDEARPFVDVRYEAGDLVIFDSYRLHRIQPFGGGRDRISATLHGAAIGGGRWESWF